MNDTTFKAFLHRVGSMVITALVIVVITIAGITLFFGEQSQQERDTLQEIRNATLAEVCVLALPVRPEGRSENAVEGCLRQHGLIQ